MKPKFRKGQLVEYKLLSGDVVDAVVRTVHRNGEVTVEARFCRNSNGVRYSGYLGYRYRYASCVLRAAQ